MKIEIIIENENWNEKKIKKLIEDTTESVFSYMKLKHDDIELSVLCTDDKEIQILNKTYRGVDSPTNVLSFPMDAESDNWDCDDFDFDEFDYDKSEFADLKKDCGCHGNSSDSKCNCRENCCCDDALPNKDHSENDDCNCGCEDNLCYEDCCCPEESEELIKESAWVLGCAAFAYETIEREAKSQGKTFDNHMKHLVIHSVLHLLGYDHIENEEAEKMEDLEIKILQSIGVSNPYQTEK